MLRADMTQDCYGRWITSIFRDDELLTTSILPDRVSAEIWADRQLDEWAFIPLDPSSETTHD